MSHYIIRVSRLKHLHLIPCIVRDHIEYIQVHTTITRRKSVLLSMATSSSKSQQISAIPILNLRGDFFKEIPYKAGRRIGSGMSGSVIEAVNENDSSKKWAVKVIPLHGDKISKATAHRLFTREMDVLRLDHDHAGIVKCILAAKCRDHLYIMMKLYPCGDLATCLPSIPACVKAWMAGRIADAVAFLHGKRFTHGDIKPDNILIDDGFEPVLGDFGLARHFQYKDLEFYSTFGGTAGFWAPEIQAADGLGELVDPFKVDVYAFGVVTLYMLASVCPSVGVDYLDELSKANHVCPEERSILQGLLEPDFTKRLSAGTAAVFLKFCGEKQLRRHSQK